MTDSEPTIASRNPHPNPVVQLHLYQPVHWLKLSYCLPISSTGHPEPPSNYYLLWRTTNNEAGVLWAWEKHVPTYSQDWTLGPIILSLTSELPKKVSYHVVPILRRQRHSNTKSLLYWTAMIRSRTPMPIFMTPGIVDIRSVNWFHADSKDASNWQTKKWIFICKDTTSDSVPPYGTPLLN